MNVKFCLWGYIDMIIQINLYDNEILLPSSEIINVEMVERVEKTDDSSGYNLIRVETDDIRNVIISTPTKYKIIKTTYDADGITYVFKYDYLNK